MRASSILWSCLASLVAVCAVHAGSPTSIELAGLEACSGKQPATIESSEVLDGVARELSLGIQLNDAIDRVGYASAGADSLYLKTARPMSDDAVRRIVVDRYCTAANDASFKEFGTFRNGQEVWIVLASPMDRPAAPVVGDPATVASRVLDLVNAARAQSRRCGDRKLPAARPLRLSPALTEAADRHARDMAQHGAFAHLGSDGTKPSERVSQAGYRWRAVGENIAAGQADADAVVASWLTSPGHCANIMGHQFKEMGVAFALAPSRSPPIYWSLELASPR